jgi:hypothetical protein
MPTTPDIPISVHEPAPGPRTRSPRAKRRRKAASAPPGGVRFYITMALIAATTALAGVLVSGWTARQNAIHEETKIRQAALQPCLDPRFWDRLVDPSPDVRAMALVVLKTCNVDAEILLEINRAVLLHDTSPKVQGRAETAVRTFTRGSEPKLRLLARRTLSDYGLLSELRAKGLLSTLEEAAAYADARSWSATEQAVVRYNHILRQLSAEAIAALDPVALAKSEAAARAGATDRAAAMFSRLFQPYVQNR